ncbi:hypothetical protein ACPCUV_36375 [Streptomyces platensis]|uniref:hypothetical protein n=1 Tax=Streptomyces TaxID=1883 RepID=UPI0025B2AD61|nr:hypothetical protein [Streptomyces sp. P9-2B-2]WJY43165.1 hypothetical protein QT196_38520 [Streptomyces sp. P9-2B-2]
MKLNDLSPLMARRRDGGLSFDFDRFRADPGVAALQWPDDVLRDFLFDHGDNGHFVDDYGDVDLCAITWKLETIPAAAFPTMPTGESDAGCIESYAADPVYWVKVRPPEIGRHWEDHGTWMRPPLLIDRRLLDPADSGLQVLEGRTRVGVLRGRLREQLRVAPHHQAWVGRP